MRLKLLAIVALIGGPIFGYSVRKEMQERAVIEKDGVTVPGVIVDGETSTRKGNKTTRFNIEYATPDGKKTVKKFRVPKTFAETYVKGDALVRDDVQVRCLASDPEKSILVGAGNGNPEMEYIGYGLGLVGLVGTGFMFRRKKAEEFVPPVAGA